MSITEILEKYATKDPYGMTFIEDDLFPEIESDLNKLLEDRAIAFGNFMGGGYKLIQDEDGTVVWRKISTELYYTTSELYALFLTNKNKTDEANPNQ